MTQALIPASRLVKSSMSKTDLLLICPYLASDAITIPAPPSPSPQPLRFGSAYHKGNELVLRGKKPNLKAIAKKYDLNATDEERLKDFHARWRDHELPRLRRLIGGVDREYIEQKIAYDPYADSSRFLFETGERDYSGRKPNEIPGTEDWVAVPTNKDYFFVFDWKTGRTTYEAAKNGQLKSLAVAFHRLFRSMGRTFKKAVGILDRIDDAFLEPYEAEFSEEQMNAHRDNLATAISRARSPNPPMVPGLHCKELYCPAIRVCPAHAGPDALADEMHGQIEPERKAMLYARFKAAERMVEAFGDWWKRELEMNGPFQLENGKWAILGEDPRENISKASIRRALGAEDGEELISQLRERGCVESTSVKKIKYVNDPASKP